MFANLKALVDKSKQEKSAQPAVAIAAPKPLVVASDSKPNSVPTDTTPTTSSSATVPVSAPPPPQVSATLISLLQARIMFIDQCLLSFAVAALKHRELRETTPCENETGNENEPTLLHVPSQLEADAWASVFVVSKIDKALAAAVGEPDAKRSRSESHTSRNENAYETSLPLSNIATLLTELISASGAQSDNNIRKAVRTILRGLYNLEGLITTAAEAQGDSARLNHSVTQQGAEDRAVVLAALIATKNSASIEVTLQWETSIAAALLRLCESRTLENCIENNAPHGASALIRASNVYTVLLLLSERQVLLREVIGYQHRWEVAEERRVASLKANSLIVSRDGPSSEPLPTSSVYTRSVVRQVRETDKALRSLLNRSTDTSPQPPLSTAVEGVYNAIFGGPQRQMTEHTQAKAGGAVTPNMLLNQVSAPSESSDEWIIAKVNEDTKGSDVSKLLGLFRTTEVYRQCLQSSKGDLRARLQVLIDSLEGCGGVTRALIDDALAIHNAANRNTYNPPDVSQSKTNSALFATLVDLFPGDDAERKKLIEGSMSLVLPEKLRSVVIGVGLCLHAALRESSSTLSDLSGLLVSLATGVQNDNPLLPTAADQFLSSFRAIQSRPLQAAESLYFSYTIGTEKWVTGIMGNSLHMRRSLEKIQSSRIAHVMNNSTVQVAMLAIKRLITFVTCECQLEARLV